MSSSAATTGSVTDAREIVAGAVVVATGTRPRKLGVPGEDELEGKGLEPLRRLRRPALPGSGRRDGRRRRLGALWRRWSSRATTVEVVLVDPDESLSGTGDVRPARSRERAGRGQARTRCSRRSSATGAWRACACAISPPASRRSFPSRPCSSSRSRPDDGGSLEGRDLPRARRRGRGAMATARPHAWHADREARSRGPVRGGRRAAWTPPVKRSPPRATAPRRRSPRTGTFAQRTR